MLSNGNPFQEAQRTEHIEQLRAAITAQTEAIETSEKQIKAMKAYQSASCDVYRALSDKYMVENELIIGSAYQNLINAMGHRDELELTQLTLHHDRAMANLKQMQDALAHLENPSHIVGVVGRFKGN